MPLAYPNTLCTTVPALPSGKLRSQSSNATVVITRCAIVAPAICITQSLVLKHRHAIGTYLRTTRCRGTFWTSLRNHGRSFSTGSTGNQK